jgi:hypothetical protein
MLKEIDSVIYRGYKVNKAGSSFILEETGREASCKEARFIAKNEYLVYKFDNCIARDGCDISHLFPFFNDGKAQAMCDYIIFYEKSDHRLFAVICNLKSKKKSNNQDQLKAGQIFSKFIFETSRRLYPETFSGITLEITSVLFSTIRLYTNKLGNKGIINMLSNDQVKEKFIFEHKCN